MDREHLTEILVAIARLEEKVDAFSKDDLDDRITKLEHGRTRLTAVVSTLSFLGPVAAYFATRLGLMGLLLGLLGSTSCVSAVAVLPDVPKEWRLGAGMLPVRMSLWLSPACKAAVIEGVGYWNDQLGWERLGDVREHVGGIQPGAVTISTRAVEKGFAATTWSGLAPFDDSGEKYPFADIAFAKEEYCLEPWYAAHELGHALGLGHSADVFNVMFPDARLRAWAVSDEQKVVARGD